MVAWVQPKENYLSKEMGLFHCSHRDSLHFKTPAKINKETDVIQRCWNTSDGPTPRRTTPPAPFIPSKKWQERTGRLVTGGVCFDLIFSLHLWCERPTKNCSRMSSNTPNLNPYFEHKLVKGLNSITIIQVLRPTQVEFQHPLLGGCFVSDPLQSPFHTFVTAVSLVLPSTPVPGIPGGTFPLLVASSILAAPSVLSFLPASSPSLPPRTETWKETVQSRTLNWSAYKSKTNTQLTLKPE